MKILLSQLLLILVITNSYSQLQNNSYQPIIPSSKSALLRDVDVIFNTRMGLDVYFENEDLSSSKFAANQFRLEIKGKIHEKVFFRFRNRYTKMSEPLTVDNLNRSIDFACITINASPQTKFTLGKMIGNWGGYELILNPIDVLCYNTINVRSELFLVGASLNHLLEDTKNEFGLQILNTTTTTLEQQFGAKLPSNITPSEIPFSTVVNWRGKLFNSKLETTYSYVYHIDAKNADRNYFSLGNKINLNKLTVYYDFEYSQEDLDKKMVVSEIIKNKQSFAAQDVCYIGNWIRAEYKIKPQINLLLSVMNNNSYWNGNPDPNKEEKLASSYAIIPTIEYNPFSDLNLKFYLGYIGTKYNYSNYAESNFNSNDRTASQITIGIISPLLVL